MGIGLGFLLNEDMSQYLKDRLSKERSPIDGVTFVRRTTGLIVYKSPIVQVIQETHVSFPYVWKVHGGRLYAASAVPDTDSRFAFSVPRSWHTLDDDSDVGSVLGRNGEVITPLMGAIQFWCSMVDGLEYDESIADIERQLLSAVSYADLEKRGYDMYLPPIHTMLRQKWQRPRGTSQLSRDEEFMHSATGALEWQERVKEEITRMVAYF